jgi:ubiquinone/menaquinone biosynthesis C-methylase UbiE/uncharacterized iron-regulated protein
MSQNIRGRLFRLSPPLFGKEISLQELLENDVKKTKYVLIGEHHGSQPIIDLGTNIQEQMAKCVSKTSFNNNARLRVVMEHFSIPMSPMLSKFTSGSITIKALMEEYNCVGTEGFDLKPYVPLLESAKSLGNVEIYGGFIPRTFARLLMKEGKEKALEEARMAGFVSPHETLEGTDQHYNFFESLLTGRNMHHDPPGKLVSDRFRKMFPAQIIKDASMAWCIHNLNRFDLKGDDRMLIVCGIGHMLYSHGVPERMISNGINPKDIMRVACIPTTNKYIVSGDVDTKEDVISLLHESFGGPENDAADICFIYEDDYDSEEDEEMIRAETREAYDKVGSTAHLSGGDLRKARSILKSLHYTSNEIEFVGIDAVNYQGVGCPHRHALIQPGEHVIDLGSGLGVDSLIALNATGDHGRVVGIDLSKECVNHANKRSTERGLDENLSYVQSQIESIGYQIDDESFDVAISNGAFCLLPNKEEGFRECFRVLKKRGRIAICTTVVKDHLEENVKWPLCMRMFSKMSDIVPLLEKIGFVDIEIDLSDSLMEVEDVNKEMEKASDSQDSLRYKVHNKEGQNKYRYLESYDMNDLCSRVVIKARKP